MICSGVNVKAEDNLIRLDLNVRLNGAMHYNFSDGLNADIYIDDKLVVSGVDDYNISVPDGTKYKVILHPDSKYTAPKTVYEGTVADQYADIHLFQVNVDLYTIGTHTITVTGDEGIESIDGCGPYNIGDTATLTYHVKDGYHIFYTSGDYFLDSYIENEGGQVMAGGKWTTLAGNTGIVSDSITMLDGDITRQVVTAPNTYTVNYDGNWADSGTTDSTIHTYGTKKALAKNGFQKKGYFFEQWNTKPDGTGVSYKNGADVSNLNVENGSALTLYAIWSQVSDTFTFTVPTNLTINTDTSGTFSSKIHFEATTKQRRWVDVSVSSENDYNLVDDSDSTNKVPYQISEKSFSFEAQYRENNTQDFEKDITISGSDSNKKAGSYSDKVIFTVQSFADTRTIILDCNGGTVDGKPVIQYTVADGSSYGELPMPVRSGYQFLAWQDSEGNTIYSGSVVTSTTERLSAEWLPYRVLCIESYINGVKNEYLQNVGTFDVFQNGRQIRYSSSSVWASSVAGDVFECNNFKIVSKFKYVGVHSGELPKGVTINTDAEGNIDSIHVVLQENNDASFNLDFVTSTPLQDIIDNSGATTLIFDDDKPAQNVNVIGILDGMFEDSVEAYVNNNELHLYNLNGGKIKAPQNSTNLLSYTLIDSIDANNLDISDVTNASYMFAGCSKSSNIYIQNLDTSNIQYLQYMFYGCTSVGTLEVENWNLASAKSIVGMFSYSGISSINLSKWDVSKITSLERLFFKCNNLQSLDLHTWDTSSVKSLYWMFRDCNTIKTIDVSGWNTSNVTSMDRMFGECPKLTTIIGLDSFDTSKVTQFSVMFISDSSLKELNLSSFDTRNCKQSNSMFDGCWNLQTIYVSENFSLEKAINTTQMFRNCKSLVGGAGTAYAPTFIDGTAARIDGGSESPGYFTNIADKLDDNADVYSTENNDIANTTISDDESELQELDQNAE